MLNFGKIARRDHMLPDAIRRIEEANSYIKPIDKETIENIVINLNVTKDVEDFVTLQTYYDNISLKQIEREFDSIISLNGIHFL